MHPLGQNARRIESEYLERLNKVRYGLDGGWRPPGLMLAGGDAARRTAALQHLRQLTIADGFPCGIVALNPDLSLLDPDAISAAALHAAGLPGESQAALHEQARKNGLIVLFDSVDAPEGDASRKAAYYREISRWMGTLPGASDIGLFCTLAITHGFENALPADEQQLREAALDRDLLEEALIGLRGLEHERTVLELLQLSFAD